MSAITWAQTTVLWYAKPEQYDARQLVGKIVLRVEHYAPDCPQVKRAPSNSSVMRKRGNFSNDALSRHLVGTLTTHWRALLPPHLQNIAYFAIPNNHVQAVGQSDIPTSHFSERFYSERFLFRKVVSPKCI